MKEKTIPVLATHSSHTISPQNEKIERVNCNGMYRSGSTLSFILMNELNRREGFRLTVYKKHHERYCANALNIYTFRDLRDVLRSFCIKYGKRLTT